VLVVLGYSLWRIHKIEVAIKASDRYLNLTQLIETNNLNHRRQARSVDLETFRVPNNIDIDEKELPRGMLTVLTAKNENIPQHMKKPKNKDEFLQLMNTLFDKIQMMHNDTERSHFDNNMKAVFQAWFPVFDSLLPRDLMGNDGANGRVPRSADKTSEESSEEKKTRNTRSAKVSSEDSKTSGESSEEKKQRKTRSAESSSSSEESFEEKKRGKVNSLAEKSSEESFEDKKRGKVNSLAKKSSEESAEEKKPSDNVRLFYQVDDDDQLVKTKKF